MIQRGDHVIEFVVQHMLAPGIERDSTRVFHSLRPISVQLDFVGPARALRNRRYRQTFHRIYELGRTRSFHMLLKTLESSCYVRPSYSALSAAASCIAPPLG